MIDYDKCGIYVLFNTKTRKAYVGKSRDVKKRLKRHVLGFKQKSSDLKMYADDIDDFISILVYQISDDAYAKFSSAYEISCMLELTRWGIELYNIRPENKSRHGYDSMISFHFLSAIDSAESMKTSFISQCDVAPWKLKYIKEKDADRIKKHNMEYKHGME